jgi:L-lactate dehydrogenase complex protein LldG
MGSAISLDLINQFARAANNAAASVERIKRAAVELDHALRRATQGAQRIIVAEPDDLSPELLAPFRKAPGVNLNPTDDELAASQVGITDAFAGVARTGSVCVSITRKQGGAISLFVPFHICIIEAENIVARPLDLFSSHRLAAKGLSRNFVFVTGPSATADMGPLVRGVHGPGKVHIIILE